MSKVLALITMSVDGYITGPNDGPGCGLGVGGERLHNWVFGGTWRYDSAERGQMLPDDQAWFGALSATMGAVIGGRGTYEAAEHWGDQNPSPVPFFVVTHRPEDEPPGHGFNFVGSIAEAAKRARAVAGEKTVHVMGGAGIIRQFLEAGLVDELTIIVAPLILGDGKRLFDGFAHSIELEQLGVRQSRFATFLEYRVMQSPAG
jgi:dihydrofolate reductase